MSVGGTHKQIGSMTPPTAPFVLCGGACRKAFVKLHHPGEGAVPSELGDPPEWGVSSIKRLA
jgi:hypothetical protein